MAVEYTIEQKVDNLSTSVDAMHTKMSKMEGQVKEMYSALVGNKNFGHDGLVQRIEVLETTKEKWKNKVNWMYGYMVGIGTFVTLLVEYLKNKIG